MKIKKWKFFFWCTVMSKFTILLQYITSKFVERARFDNYEDYFILSFFKLSKRIETGFVQRWKVRLSCFLSLDREKKYTLKNTSLNSGKTTISFYFFLHLYFPLNYSFYLTSFSLLLHDGVVQKFIREYKEKETLKKKTFIDGEKCI